MKKQIKKMFANRQTVKAYSDKKINKNNWKLILDSIYWSPTSLGGEPYRVLIINKNNKLRKDLFELFFKQDPALNSDKLIFFISLKEKGFKNQAWLKSRADRYAKKVMNLKGKELKNTSAAIVNRWWSYIKNEGDEWPNKQAYIALGTSIHVASLLGVSSTAMEGFDVVKTKKLFIKKGLMTNNEQLSVAVAFGYPKSKTAYSHRGTNVRVRDPFNKKFKEI